MTFHIWLRSSQWARDKRFWASNVQDEWDNVCNDRTMIWDDYFVIYSLRCCAFVDEWRSKVYWTIEMGRSKVLLIFEIVAPVVAALTKSPRSYGHCSCLRLRFKEIEVNEVRDNWHGLMMKWSEEGSHWKFAKTRNSRLFTETFARHCTWPPYNTPNQIILHRSSTWIESKIKNEKRWIILFVFNLCMLQSWLESSRIMNKEWTTMNEPKTKQFRVVVEAVQGNLL